MSKFTTFQLSPSTLNTKRKTRRIIISIFKHRCDVSSRYAMFGGMLMTSHTVALRSRGGRRHCQTSKGSQPVGCGDVLVAVRSFGEAATSPAEPGAVRETRASQFIHHKYLFLYLSPPRGRVCLT